jgi:hypothetical protein
MIGLESAVFTGPPSRSSSGERSVPDHCPGFLQVRIQYQPLSRISSYERRVPAHCPGYHQVRKESQPLSRISLDEKRVLALLSIYSNLSVCSSTIRNKEAIAIIKLGE